MFVNYWRNTQEYMKINLQDSVYLLLVVQWLEPALAVYWLCWTEPSGSWTSSLNQIHIMKNVNITSKIRFQIITEPLLLEIIHVFNTCRLLSAAVLYLGELRWSPGPASPNSHWRSAGGTWCERRHGTRGLKRRQSHSSATRSPLQPLDPDQHRQVERRASGTHNIKSNS